MSIGAIAIKEVADFKDKGVPLTSGSMFNQYQNVQRIIRYMNGEFWQNSDTNDLFYQMSTNRAALYAKSIDMNSKDYYTVGIGKTNWYQNWILNVRFKKWVQDSRFALILDDVAIDIAVFGSTVWKKVIQDDGTTTIEMCDLRNLAFDPTVKNIIDSPVVETHYFTEQQLRSKWADKTEMIMEHAKKARDNEGNQAETEDDKYMIYERWGEYEGKYVHYIGTGSGTSETIIVEDEIKIKNGKPVDFPYFDLHGERIKGRWQGLGVVERLFEIQEQVNTLVNQNNEVNNIASLLLLRSEDPRTVENVSDLVNGQVIQSEDLQEVNLNNRFLQGFIAQLRVLEDKADKLCYINESISGETPPSGVPFRSLAVATRASVSTFQYIKTASGEKMGYILQEEILPSLVKGFNKEDVIEIAEDEADIRLFDQTRLNAEVEAYKLDRAKAGYVIFEEDIEELINKKRSELEFSKREAPIGKNFFDFEYGIKMNPTGESVDKNAQNSAIDAAIAQMIAAPAVVNTPLFQQKLENNNIPPFRLTVEEQTEISQTKQPGQPMPTAPQDKLSDRSAI